MTPANADVLDRIVEAISDGADIDWAAEMRAHRHLSGRLEQLRHLQRIAHANGMTPEVETTTIARPAVHDGGSASPEIPMGHWGALRLLERIGHGGFGDVYRAYDPSLQREVALKLLRSDRPAPRERTQRLLDEARRLARIRHRNVLAVHGAGEHDGRLGVWTELLQGKTLQDFGMSHGCMGAQEAILVGLDLCAALSALHRAGLVHGDVKPANVMREQGGRIVLMDFGSAAERLETEPDAGGIEGTPLFMAPELLKGGRPSPASDIYALGTLLYWLVSGRFPLATEDFAAIRDPRRKRATVPLRDVRADLPAGFVQVIERTLQHDVALRPASVGELELDLSRCLQGPASPRESKVEGSRSRRWVATSIGAAAIAGIVALAWVRWSSLRVDVGLYRQGENEQRLTTGDVIRAGDRLFLRLESSKDIHLYVINESADGEALALFPTQSDSRSASLPGRTRHRLPLGPAGEAASWEVTSAPGAETVMVLATTAPREAIEMALAALPLPAGRARRVRGLRQVVQDNEPASFTTRLEALARNSGDEGLEVWKIELQNGSATESAGDDAGGAANGDAAPSGQGDADEKSPGSADEASTSQTGVKVSNPIPSLHIPADARVGATPDQLLRALGMEDGTAALGALRVQRTRGASQAAYPQVAPATVVVRTTVGHGAGILVDAGGWILTNAHCVSSGTTDLATGALSVEIHLGRLQAAQMELESRAFPALVYKKSEEKDLALVKLTNLPADIGNLSAIALAPKGPVIGSDCVAVGHPAAGMLWTARSCEVANIGTWPEHQIDFVITRLQAKGSDQEERLRLLASHMPRLKILISSCGLNPGDSGGPLVDTRGQLIGLTFAIPATDPSSSVSLDKFAYHVHVDEVREFLKERAEVPLLHVPNPWPPAAFSVLMDLDADGAPETLAFGLVPNAPTTGLLVDLDQSFLPGFAVESLTEAGASDRLDFEFGWQPGDERRTYYDSNDDGTFDLTLVDLNADGVADLELNRQGENWLRGRGPARGMEDASAVPAAMRQRFMHIMEVLRAQMQEK